MPNGHLHLPGLSSDGEVRFSITPQPPMGEERSFSCVHFHLDVGPATPVTFALLPASDPGPFDVNLLLEKPHKSYESCLFVFLPKQ